MEHPIEDQINWVVYTGPLPPITDNRFNIEEIIREMAKQLWYLEQPYRRISGKPCPYDRQ